MPREVPARFCVSLQPGILIARISQSQFAIDMDAGQAPLVEKAKPVIEALVIGPGCSLQVPDMPLADMPGGITFFFQTLG